MGRQTYLIRRGGAYSARLRVPLDLIDVVGRKELVKALGTSDPAEAKRRVWAVVDAWQRHFDALRNRAEMSDDDKEDLVWSHYTGMLDRDDQRRAAVPTEAEIEQATERAVARVQRENIDMKDPLKVLDVALEIKVMKDGLAGVRSTDATARRMKLKWLRQHLTTNESALVSHEIDDFLYRRGLTIGSAERAELVRQLIRAEIEALQRTLERDEGNYGGAPADQLIKRVTERQVASTPGENIMDIFEAFARENVAGVSRDRINQMRRDIGLLVQITGDRFPVSMIDKKVVR